jgi:hypothetical protein
MPPLGYCRMVMNRAAESKRDPVVALRAAFDAALIDVDYIVLAVRLALEVGRDERSVLTKRDLEGFEVDIADVIVQCIPALAGRARDLAHSLTSLVVTAAATNTDLSPAVFWRQGAAIVRGYLLDAGIAPERFDAVFGGLSVDQPPP